MTSIVDFSCDLGSLDTSSSSALQQLVKHTAGADLGFFGEGEASFPETCLRQCLVSPEKKNAEGGCEIVCSLANGGPVKEMEFPQTCDQGHQIAVHTESPAQLTILELHPLSSGKSRAEGELNPIALQAARDLWQHSKSLAVENDGMASELLRAYEQLNVLFGITKQIGAHQDVAQIKLSLVQKLAETLACSWACCISKNEGTLWWSEDGQVERSAMIAHLEAFHADTMEEVATHRKIIVRGTSDATGERKNPSLMFAPLGGEDGEPDVVIFGRGENLPDYESNDMLTADSVLSHGGHVVENLNFIERLKSMSFEAVRALISAIDMKDEYTSGHSERVGFLSRLIGEQMGLPLSDLQDLEWAGLLHDVGKIGISDAILKKTGKLTDEEYDTIKQHPRMSYEVILPIHSFSSVREPVLYHHELPDGTGYPAGLKDDEIPTMARIVHVADTFDALTSSRSYRPGFPLEKALTIMNEEAGPKLDLEVMAAFNAALSKFRTEQPSRFAQLFNHIQEQDE